MSAHTPGPWAVDGSQVVTLAEGLPQGRTYGFGCGRDFVADLNDGEYHEYADDAEQEANARIIAAAPDMLEALRGAAKWCHQRHGDFPSTSCGLCKPLLAAIAKAEGR